MTARASVQLSNTVDVTAIDGATSRIIADLSEEIKAAHILIVDDDAVARTILVGHLSRVGFSRFAEAKNGQMALDLLDSEKRFDIVLLDINMPGLSGYEVCQKIRDRPEFKDLPILVQSGASSNDERSRVFAVGATDFVSKPLNPPEMIARVRMHLENRRLIGRLIAFRCRMEEELETARAMQEHMAPKDRDIQDLAGRYGLNMRAFAQSSSELGGDLWDLWPIDRDRLGICLADVSGHGVGAAMSAFRLSTLLADVAMFRPSPDALVEELNRRLCDFMSTGHFVTFCYGMIDTRSNFLRYCNAGGMPPLIIRSGPQGIRVISGESTGIPIGIRDTERYEIRDIDLLPDDIVLFYSDSLVEERRRDGTQLGETGLYDMIATLFQQERVRPFMTDLLSAFFKIIPAPLSDDLTLISIGNGRGHG